MKRKLAFLAFATFCFTANAQTYNSEALLEECQRLHATGENATALTLINKIDADGFDARTRQEFELLKALATFECNHLEGRALLLQYLDDYPESAQREILNGYIAQSYYYGKNFGLACNWFKKCDFERLQKDDSDKAKLFYALSLMECGEEEHGMSMLRELAVTSKKHGADARFHIAIADYDNNRIDEAYKGFKEIELNDKYYLEVPYYIAGIYLKKGEIGHAESMARSFIADHGDKMQGVKMHQILGAAEYAKGNYSKAIAPLAKYVKEYPTPQRIAYYQLGLSYFEEGNYDEAMKMFDICSDGNDAMAQNSFLHIGIIRLEKGNTAGARMAFEHAANMTNDSRIREEAMYNYALCIHQTRYSPFAESVKVFERFLNEYPDSKHAAQVSKYLVEVYMNTRNYDVALQSIEKIKRPSADILKAKQKVLYRLGVQQFINGNMDSTIIFMNRSIELKKHDKTTHAEALLWRGEAYYAKKDYNKAISSYKEAIATGACPDSEKAFYGMGYSYFQLGKYKDALYSFNKALSAIPAKEKQLRADALNRIADCYFYQRDYAKADSYYRKAVETDNGSGDYALYRSALTQGLSKDYAGKVATLKRLVAGYPASIYAEQAYYEMGRAYVEQEKYAEAIEVFDILMKKFPENALARRAAVEKAMAYNINGETDKAVAAYKFVIEKYPYSEEAYTAIQDLKNIYVEIGKVDEYAKYAGKTKGMKVNTSEIDTLTYTAAEKIYNRGETAEARGKFQSYLKNFPDGAFTLDCHYHLGVIFYNDKTWGEALKHFEEVIAYPDNKYSEEAMVYAADISYSNKDYEKATGLYKQLLAKSGSEERRTLARTRIMRAAWECEKHAEVIKYAGELLAGSNIAPEIEREAAYKRAKAYIATGEKESAAGDLKRLAGDTRTKEGAEAKYLVAQMMFDNGEYENCEKEIMNYIEASTPHAYWLARSFILLSDLYTAQGKTMEAKQFLLSLQNNYSGNDDIAEMIETRLKKLMTE